MGRREEPAASPTPEMGTEGGACDDLSLTLWGSALSWAARERQAAL